MAVAREAGAVMVDRVIQSFPLLYAPLNSQLLHFLKEGLPMQNYQNTSVSTAICVGKHQFVEFAGHALYVQTLICVRRARPQDSTLLSIHCSRPGWYLVPTFTMVLPVTVVVKSLSKALASSVPSALTLTCVPRAKPREPMPSITICCK
jgi:hypothetical protein